ncbi:hypothetical protein ACFC1T_09270 [Kitasatospora sp. NPDC056076]|uniref:hypothetical protein n=1 Tax=Kitasatospora sp. NPDC056076 TaxID=3345703 RepID=UPI0035E1D411
MAGIPDSYTSPGGALRLPTLTIPLPEGCAAEPVQRYETGLKMANTLLDEILGATDTGYRDDLDDVLDVLFETSGHDGYMHAAAIAYTLDSELDANDPAFLPYATVAVGHMIAHIRHAQAQPELTAEDVAAAQGPRRWRIAGHAAGGADVAAELADEVRALGERIAKLAAGHKNAGGFEDAQRISAEAMSELTAILRRAARAELETITAV